jgi:hypothetical protein
MNLSKWIALGLLVLVIVPGSPVAAIDKMQPKVLAAFRDVVSSASYSTVKVLADGKQIALGSSRTWSSSCRLSSR